ncbi:3-hydroxyacyl-CoA dehydrogenase NAD-binding domain-containing protein [Desulfosporosinus sp. PR]|uniref:3-hydroxyacyl-CoA dehydrogenase family protein n=1 Tax=Candidatus Desulfosporosinus nitrosoreducens TaxID=3401928 RepID=UPI0027EE117D|nr:3-hydroxyacyl-CoA dehydrogenase NAD-binding domain-containing protein [Desulfosporosinus sp. PR]MDQ7092897.1 3-hydroxyacyl-CoA dehydrogenase NAD-binding domain-containing protein [Desulfosporosinus sp. PR]
MEIKKVGVLGAGTMGAGIAQVCIQAGYNVVLIDIVPGIVDKALAGLDKAWAKAIEKGKATAEAVANYKTLVTTSTDVNDFKDVDLVIEAIVENIDVKKKAHKQLGEICKPEAILASNTSALSITEIAAATNRPDKFVGMHFFNPVVVMKLVEVIPGIVTADETTQTVLEVARKIGKDPVLAKESPGFIVNRILVPYMNEAANVYQEGIATLEEIDKAMKLGAGMPMGPLELADMVGIDIVLAVCEFFYNEFGDSKYRPSLAFKQKVRAGHLGRKTGKGFYDYSK